MTTSTSRSACFRGAPLQVIEAAPAQAGPADGVTIGYLHGMIGCPIEHPLLTALADRGQRVIAPNLPGFGGSAPCADIRSMYDWVAATSEIIDIVGLAGRHLIASSVGAMLALEVAAVRPEAFSALTLIAPFGLWDDADPTTDPFATTLSSQRALLTNDPALTSWFFDDQPNRSSAELIDDNVRRYATRSAAASLVWPIPEFGLSTRIHRVTCPVAILWGDRDRLNPLSYLPRYIAALPHATAHTIDAAGHLADWDRPTAIADLISV